MAKLKRILTPILSILLALLFILSGWTKGIDPYGVSLSVTEYLRWMGLTSLVPYATWLGVALCTFELTIGLLLFSATMERFVSFALLLFMLLFTTITGILAFNPYSGIVSCGCFGEAFPLTPYATFWKNVIITLLVILYFISLRAKLSDEEGEERESIDVGDKRGRWRVRCRNFNSENLKREREGRENREGNDKIGWFKMGIWGVVKTIVAIGIALSIPLYSLINLPPLDFLHYNIGTDLREREDFRLFDDDFEEVADEFLSESNGYRFVAIVQSKPSEEEMEFLDGLCDCSIVAAGLKISSSPTSSVYYTDALLLKSLLRRERGVLLLKSSKIVGKWSVRGANRICPDDPKSLEIKAKRGVTLYFLLYALILIAFSATRFSPNLSYLRNQEQTNKKS